MHVDTKYEVNHDPAAFPVGIRDTGASRSQQKVGDLRAAIIECGTSCATFLLQEDLSPIGIEDSLLALLTQESRLSHDHYQNNKIGVVATGSGPHNLLFRFFQADRYCKKMLDAPECANVAAGSAAFALIERIAEPDSDGWLYGENVVTKQRVSMRVPMDAPYSNGVWTVRFLQEAFSLRGLAITRFFSSFEGSASVDCALLVRGNLFVFVNLHPATANARLVDALTTAASGIAEQLGIAKSRADVPKIILYAEDKVSGCEAWLDTACFFCGEKHKSLPGSGAMTLAGYLALSHIRHAGTDAAAEVFQFHMRHPSGALSVCAHLQWGAEGVHVSATEFKTSICVSMSDQAGASQSGGSVA